MRALDVVSAIVISSACTLELFVLGGTSARNSYQEACLPGCWSRDFSPSRSCMIDQFEFQADRCELTGSHSCSEPLRSLRWSHVTPVVRRGVMIDALTRILVDIDCPYSLLACTRLRYQVKHSPSVGPETLQLQQPPASSSSQSAASSEAALADSFRISARAALQIQRLHTASIPLAADQPNLQVISRRVSTTRPR